MSFFADCPLPEVLPSIDKPECPFRLGQLQQLAFRLKPPKNQTTPTFATEADLLTLTKWTTAIAATDESKILLAPYMTGVVIPSSESQYLEGGNNNTIDGIPMYVGEGNVQVTGRWVDLDPAIADQIRELTPFTCITAGITYLEAFFFDENGRIIARKAADGAIHGFDIYNLVCASLGTEGYNTPSITPLGFSLKPDWDKGMIMVDPNVNGTPTTWSARENLY